jgi:hypothetical protein
VRQKRNLVRAGVSKTVAQKITGHKSGRMFDRYDITDSTTYHRR